MNNELNELIKNAQNNDSVAMMKIIERFTLLIKKYTRKLKYDGAYTDLLLCLIKLVKTPSIFEKNNLINEKEITAYICVAIKNQYIRLAKKYNQIYSVELLLEEIQHDPSIVYNLEEQVILKNAIEKLPKIQKQIIEMLFLSGYKEIDIAKKLNISRQAVNKTKKRALKNIKKYLN